MTDSDVTVTAAVAAARGVEGPRPPDLGVSMSSTLAARAASANTGYAGAA